MDSISKGIVIHSIKEIENKIVDLNSKKFVLSFKFMLVEEEKQEE